VAQLQEEEEEEEEEVILWLSRTADKDWQCFKDD
jgi:hypothetical protein